jgi:transcriptional regulator with XRE-family HTH domain
VSETTIAQADDSLVSQVGMRIRKLRTEQGISLRDFGKQAGVHPFHVMAIELGQLAANTRTLRSIAKGLGVAPLDLLNHDTEESDIGFIVELMRRNPEVVGTIRERVRILVEN